MKITICCFAILLLTGCGRSVESNNTEDSSGADVTQDHGKYQHFIDNYDVAHDSYPSIGFRQENEKTNYHVEYLFEDDNMIWADRGELEKEGPDGERFLIHRDPEGDEYLYYSLWADSAFGHKEGPFEWQEEFEETMNFVRTNKDKFKLTDGFYTYDDINDKRSYSFSEVLFEANLLSPARFDAEMAKPYLNYWYPLYADASGTLYRHRLCNGNEAYIKINAEAGNYRWEEEGGDTTIVYLMKGFEESEGDAFYATIERNGNRFKKTLIIPEYDGDGANDRLLIDGQVYTSDPKKYDIFTLKCD